MTERKAKSTERRMTWIALGCLLSPIIVIATLTFDARARRAARLRDQPALDGEPRQRDHRMEQPGRDLDARLRLEFGEVGL